MIFSKHCKPHGAIQACGGWTGRKEGKTGGVGPEAEAEKGPQLACCVFLSTNMVNEGPAVANHLYFLGS